MDQRAQPVRPKQSGFVLLRPLWILIGAAVLTALFFLVLPLMQAITAKAEQRQITPVAEPLRQEEPETIEEEQPPEEKKEPDPPPELEMPELDLAQLEIAFGDSFGGGMGGGDITIDLGISYTAGRTEDMFSMAELDQKPRATFKAGPTLTREMSKAGGGTVIVIFIVDENGRVQNPRVKASDNPIYDAAAIAAIKRWRFEPGKSGGKPVASPMRIPIKFPANN